MTSLTIPENNCNPNAPVQTPICPSPQTHPHLYNKTDLLVPGAGWFWDIYDVLTGGLNINSITASGFQGTTSFSTLESGYGPFIKDLSLTNSHFKNKKTGYGGGDAPLDAGSPPALIKGHPLVRRGKRNLNTTLTLSGLSLLYNDKNEFNSVPTTAPYTSSGKAGSYAYFKDAKQVTVNIKLPNQIGADTINPVNINGLRFSNTGPIVPTTYFEGNKYLNVIVRLVSTTNDVNIYTFQVATWLQPQGNTSVSRGLTSRRERRLQRDQNRANPASNNRNGYRTGRSSSQIVSYLTNPENLAQPKVSDLECRDWQTSLIATPICPCPTSHHHHHPSYPRTDILIPGCSWLWVPGDGGECYGVSIPHITASGFRGVTGISTLNGAYGNVIKQLVTKYSGDYPLIDGSPPGLQSGPVLVRTGSRNPNITLTLGAGATVLYSEGKQPNPNNSNMPLKNKRTHIPITLPTQVGAQMVFPSKSDQVIKFGQVTLFGDTGDNFVNVIIRLVSSINGVNIYTFDVGIFNSYSDN